jgi:hypothetical protein
MQHPLPAEVGTTSPAAAIGQSVYFACGLKSMVFAFCDFDLQEHVTHYLYETFSESFHGYP